MSRRFKIVCTIIVFAFVCATSGCTSGSNPTLTSRSGAASIRLAPLSGGTWTTKAPMPTARYGLAIGVINNILYAIGGSTLKGENEAYDPATDTWTTKASVPTGRYLLAAGVVNGILYAVGGCCDRFGLALRTVEAYDPTTNTWTTKRPMKTGRFGLAVGVVNGILYAVGGQDIYPYNTVEAYDPAKDKLWTPNFNQFVSLHDRWLEDWNKVYGYRQ